jgi:hypothetical protein
MKPGARVRQIRPVRSILSLRGCSPARRRVRPNIDPPEEPGGDTDPGLSAGGRAPHDRTRRRGGRWRLSHGRSPSRGRAGRASSSAVGAERADRSLAAFPVVFVITLGLVLDAQIGARWVRSWFAPGQPFLNYPSASNLRWPASSSRRRMMNTQYQFIRSCSQPAREHGVSRHSFRRRPALGLLVALDLGQHRLLGLLARRLMLGLGVVVAEGA